MFSRQHRVLLRSPPLLLLRSRLLLRHLPLHRPLRRRQRRLHRLRDARRQREATQPLHLRARHAREGLCGSLVAVTRHQTGRGDLAQLGGEPRLRLLQRVADWMVEATTEATGGVDASDVFHGVLARERRHLVAGLAGGGVLVQHVREDVGVEGVAVFAERLHVGISERKVIGEVYVRGGERNDGRRGGSASRC